MARIGCARYAPVMEDTPLVVILAALLTAARRRCPGDVGMEDFSYAPATGSPTDPSPRSSSGSPTGPGGGTSSHRARARTIHRLDPATDRWVNTGTTTDTRRNANSDVLWHAASRKLYVVSHVFSEVGASTTPAQSGALPLQLRPRAPTAVHARPGLPGGHQRRQVSQTLSSTWTPPAGCGPPGSRTGASRQPHGRQRRPLGHAVHLRGPRPGSSRATTSRRSSRSAAQGRRSSSPTSLPLGLRTTSSSTATVPVTERPNWAPERLPDID